MPRKTSPTLTPSEQRIMDILWDKSSATVRDVCDVMNESRKVAYTTVQTIMGILEKKNYVTSQREGRAFIYAPLVSRTEAQSEALKSVVQQFFGGSAQALAQHLVREGDVDMVEIEELRDALSEQTEQPTDSETKNV